MEGFFISSTNAQAKIPLKWWWVSLLILLSVVCVVSLKSISVDKQNLPRDVPNFKLPIFPAAVASQFSSASTSTHFFDNVHLENHVVVLNFWASWCESCSSERSYLNQLFTEFGSKVLFVGVATEDTYAKIEVSGKARMIPYTILVDAEGKLLRDLGSGTLPRTIILDSHGHILGQVFGAINPKEQERIRGLLNQGLANLEGG